MNAPLQKSRLGRGLASLIGEPMPGGRPQLPPEGEQRMVPTADIRPSRLNPRKEFREDELAELTEFDPLQGPGAADHRAPGGRRL